ncbi:unnamed protein product [Periconia digitata]|uniref:Uncharacterized protein n=1 Tax=Periconia digitata TaxID=1303443 RepID=A0A9W4U5D4_9PLEO|nr:unnamed protein product [Periconia digitata]
MVVHATLGCVTFQKTFHLHNATAPLEEHTKRLDQGSPLSVLQLWGAFLLVCVALLVMSIKSGEKSGYDR